MEPTGYADFRESPYGELRRIPIPRTPVNKGIIGAGALIAPALLSGLLLCASGSLAPLLKGALPSRDRNRLSGS
jgi:hypothetical protein